MQSKLEKELASTLDDIATNPSNLVFSEQAMFSLIDLTQLDENTPTKNLEALAATACQYHVAAVCVLPQQLDAIPPMPDIKRATVANFPTGSQPHSAVLDAIEGAITQHQADEIDYVFPYQAYLDGQRAFALACCNDAYLLCKQHQRTFKVILETGALPSLEMMYRLSIDVIDSGCDFLKTSTGKLPIGATIPAAFALLSAIIDTKSGCGIKLSGGIRTKEQAVAFMQLATNMRGIKPNKTWFRLGSSRLCD